MAEVVCSLPPCSQLQWHEASHGEQMRPPNRRPSGEIVWREACTATYSLASKCSDVRRTARQFEQRLRLDSHMGTEMQQIQNSTKKCTSEACKLPLGAGVVVCFAGICWPSCSDANSPMTARVQARYAELLPVATANALHER